MFLIVVIPIIGYTVFKSRYNTPVIKGISFTNISSIRIESESDVINRKDDLYLDLNNNQDAVNNIVIWIKSSSIMGNAKDEMVSDGCSPTYLANAV